MKLLTNNSPQEQSYLATFILVSICFVLWGFTNDITGVMASAFSRIFLLNMTEGALINVANFMGYLVLAIPIAIFTQRYTYKSGVLLSLGIYAGGILLLIPAKLIGAFQGFLLAYFIMTCGSAALETCCHPLIYKMGDERKGINRLNLTQAFNALGAVIGIYVASKAVTEKLSPMPAGMRAELPPAQFNILKMHDLDTVVQPYLYVSAIIIVLLVLIRVSTFVVHQEKKSSEMPFEAFRRLLCIRNYREGVMAEFFYIGAQICLFTFMLVYARQLFIEEGMGESAADVVAGHYNIIAFIVYAAMRFVCTWLLNFIKPGRLLSIMAIIAITALAGSIIFTNRNGLYCLILACGALSMMFPTIYGMSLRGVGNDVKYASAGLTMTVFAGAVLPPLQTAIVQWDIELWGIPAINLSFIVPIVCLIVVAYYGHTGYVRHNITHNYHS